MHRQLQLSVAVPVLVTMIAFSALYFIAFLVVSSDGSTLEDPSSQAATRLGILVTGVYFLLVLVAVIFVAVRTTHRIAGPARLIEDAARGLLEGDYERRLTLRGKDHLGSLAEAVDEVRNEWRAAEVRRREFHDLVEDALARGQYDTLRALNRKLLGKDTARDSEQAA